MPAGVAASLTMCNEQLDHWAQEVCMSHTGLVHVLQHMNMRTVTLVQEQATPVQHSNPRHTVSQAQSGAVCSSLHTWTPIIQAKQSPSHAKPDMSHAE